MGLIVITLPPGKTAVALRLVVRSVWDKYRVLMVSNTAVVPTGPPGGDVQCLAEVINGVLKRPRVGHHDTGVGPAVMLHELAKEALNVAAEDGLLVGTEPVVIE
jgi:hypothetical protein